MRKLFTVSLIAFSLAVTVVSCKTVARAAFKYWTKRQVKEFITNCEEKTARLLGDESSKKYCNCAVDVVAENYRNYEDLKNISLMEVLKIATDCK